MSQTLKRKSSFTLIEICVSISILIMLTSSFAFLGYDALKEFRRRSGISAFSNYLYELRSLNATVENNILLLIEPEGQILKTTLDGDISLLPLKSKTRSFYTGAFLEEDHAYTITITPQSLPKSTADLPSWITKNDCTHTFYR